MSHDGQRFSLVGACIAQHAPHGIKTDRIFQIMFCDEFGAQGVSRHNYGLGNFSVLYIDGSGYRLFIHGTPLSQSNSKRRLSE